VPELGGAGAGNGGVVDEPWTALLWSGHRFLPVVEQVLGCG